MHAYFLTRGHKSHVDKVIKWLETRTVRLPSCDLKTGKYDINHIDLQVRPIQLWECVFPEYDKDIVLTTLKMDTPLYPNNLKMKAAVAGLRKMVGAQKVPEFKKDRAHFMPVQSMQHVAITPIGVKKDEVREVDHSGKIYEAI